MADEDKRESPVADTDSGEVAGTPEGMEQDRQPSRPQAAAGSEKGSRSSSAAGQPDSRSVSASKPASRLSSAAAECPPSSAKSGSRPTSATSERLPSAAKSGSRPTSATSERLPSAAKSGSRPTSATSERIPSAAQSGSRPTSATPERPLSSVKSVSRPTSAISRGTSSAVKSASHPPSSTVEHLPSSARSASQPAFHQTSSEPASFTVKPSSRPASVSKSASRPTSATSDRSFSASLERGEVTVPSRVGSGRPGSTTRSSSNLVKSRSGSAVLYREGSAAFESKQQEEEPPEEQEQMANGDDAMDKEIQDAPPLDEPPSNALIPVPPRRPGGGDDGGDDNGDDNNGEEEGAEDDEGSDNETALVVLDPDHPLMKRFQIALKKHLLKHDERVTLELRELEVSLKTRKKEREDLGVDLYGVQQELARYQMILESKHDEFTQKNHQRQREEQQLTDVRCLYKDTQFLFNKDKKRGAELLAEVENLALRLFYMDNAKYDVRSDIAIMRRAAEKVETEVLKAEAEKQKQDLYVDRLVERVDKLKEEMAMYEAQIIAQGEETRAARDALLEAHMEMEAIGMEKKQLYQQWNSSLIGMRRRDEAHAAMQTALNQQGQKILSLEMELEGYKKSIQKEQEQNEKLTLILAKTERDIENVRKLLVQNQARFDALKAEYTTYTRMLHETEQALNRALADKTLRENELIALRKHIEREFQEKIALEDEIMERLRTQLTLDKASQYSMRLVARTRDRTKHLEAQIAEVENAAARDTLDAVNVLARVERLSQMRDKLNEEINEKNNIIIRSDQEIIKRNSIIERKQNLIDQENKKLEAMINAAGGVELGPLEIQINSLTKTLDARQQEIVELQQQWLRQQTELVRLSQEKDKQTSDVQKHKRQLTILSQKKIRTEYEIDGQKRETCDIERSIRNMQNDVIKLNTLLYKQKINETELSQNNVLQENDFVSGLKKAELESIEMAAKLEGVKEEKERLLNSLVEAERQIMLWEKKTQLARETRAAVDSEVGQGEIRAMKAEIHRMTVRHVQLMKMQEKMIQDMEKAVSRRDTIVTQGEAQSKLKKVLTKGTFERQMTELRKKIKTTINEANECDNEIHQLREYQVELSKSLEEKQVLCQALQGSSDTLDGDVEQMVEHKQQNLADLVAKQQRLKYYQQTKENRYTMLCKTEPNLETELQKQEERVQALSTIVDRLTVEFPHTQPALRRTVLALKSHTTSDEEAK